MPRHPAPIRFAYFECGRFSGHDQHSCDASGRRPGQSSVLGGAPGRGRYPRHFRHQPDRDLPQRRAHPRQPSIRRPDTTWRSDRFGALACSKCVEFRRTPWPIPINYRVRFCRSIAAGARVLVIPPSLAAAGGQRSAPSGYVQMYSAQNHVFLNSIPNPSAATAGFTGVSNPVDQQCVRTSLAGKRRYWFGGERPSAPFWIQPASR